MIYQPGDYVCPSDLPRRFLCRVEQVESINLGNGLSQILQLEPLEGPWPAGTSLIRLDDAVTPAASRELWRRLGLGDLLPSSGREFICVLCPAAPWPERVDHETTRAAPPGSARAADLEHDEYLAQVKTALDSLIIEARIWHQA
jgi:hypothetical protein